MLKFRPYTSRTALLPLFVFTISTPVESSNLCPEFFPFPLFTKSAPVQAWTNGHVCTLRIALLSLFLFTKCAPFQSSYFGHVYVQNSLLPLFAFTKSAPVQVPTLIMYMSRNVLLTFVSFTKSAPV